MSGYSPKISAATVAAAVSTTVGGIVGPYVFPHGVPSDVKGLSLALVTAGVTFASGYLTKHTAVAREAEKVISLADELGKPFSQISEWVEDVAPAAVPTIVPASVAPGVAAPVPVLPQVGPTLPQA